MILHEHRIGIDHLRHLGRLSLLVVCGLLGLAACGQRTREEVVQDRDAWLSDLGQIGGRALTLGDVELLRPLIPTGRDCGLTRQRDAFRLGRYTCAVAQLEEGFTKPFFDAVKALARRPIADTKPFVRIGPDPDADPKAGQWQRRVEYVYTLPDIKVAVFWTVADYEGRYLLVGPPVVGQPSQ